MARGTTVAGVGVDFAVLSARAERKTQGTLLASTLTGGSHMSGNTVRARNTRAVPSLLRLGGLRS